MAEGRIHPHRLRPRGGRRSLAAVEGREPELDDELVIDQTTARQHGIALGERLTLLDREATVVGLLDEITSWAGSIAFARITTLQALLRAPGLQSFLVVSPDGDTAPGVVRDRLAGSAFPGMEVMLKSEDVANDGKLLARVYDAPIGLMVAIAFVVGVLVVGVVIYTATIEGRCEYGALKAIGARNHTLYRVVTAEPLNRRRRRRDRGHRPRLRRRCRAHGLAAPVPGHDRADGRRGVLASSLIMAVLAALIPARSVAQLEPAEVFRG